MTNNHHGHYHHDSQGHGHGHGHGSGHGHNHGLDPNSGDWRVGLAIVANLVLTAAQVIGGIVAGSLALVADALHNFSDVASLVIAFAARKIARRPADARMTFGYARIEIVAALVNYTTLIVVGLYLAYEGVLRLFAPPEVAGWYVVIIGGIALAVDLLTALLTWSMQKDSVNIRALFVHNLSDALASVAVIAGGIAILIWNVTWVDPAVTIVIAAYILYLAATEIGGTIRMLMLGAPEGTPTDDVIDAVAATDGVTGVHHAHFWQMEENAAALDVHVVVADGRWNEVERIKAAIKARLAEGFGIGHSTLEFEREDAACTDAQLYGHAEPAARPVT